MVSESVKHTIGSCPGLCVQVQTAATPSSPRAARKPSTPIASTLHPPHPSGQLSYAPMPSRSATHTRRSGQARPRTDRRGMLMGDTSPSPPRPLTAHASAVIPASMPARVPPLVPMVVAGATLSRRVRPTRTSIYSSLQKTRPPEMPPPAGAQSSAPSAASPPLTVLSYAYRYVDAPRDPRSLPLLVAPPSLSGLTTRPSSHNAHPLTRTCSHNAHPLTRPCSHSVHPLTRTCLVDRVSPPPASRAPLVCPSHWREHRWRPLYLRPHPPPHRIPCRRRPPRRQPRRRRRTRRLRHTATAPRHAATLDRSAACMPCT